LKSANQLVQVVQQTKLKCKIKYTKTMCYCYYQ